MELGTTTVIDRPVREVFASWSEVERFPEWFGTANERRKLTEGPIGVGTKYHAVDKVSGVRMEGTLEITAYQPNDLVAATLSEPYNTTWEARFEETDGSTRLTFHAVWDPSGWQRPLAPLFRIWAQRQLEKDLDRFKASVESSET